MDFLLFGMQGSGKGTQAKLIAEHCNLMIFEAGAELRRLATEDSELARKVNAILQSGNLVPTEVVMEIVANFIDHLPEGQSVLFDGIPRSQDQQEQFDEIFKKKGRDFMGILIELNEEEAMERLLLRKRNDDTPEAIRVRINTFMEKTQPVIEHYKSMGKVLAVNGVQSVEEVNRDILKAIEPYATCPST